MQIEQFFIDPCSNLLDKQFFLVNLFYTCLFLMEVIVVRLDFCVSTICNCITFVHEFLVLCSEGCLFSRKFSYTLFVRANRFQQALSCLLIAEKLGSQQLWLRNAGFSSNQMKSSLDCRVTFNQTSHLVLQQAISYLARQCYLPHMYVFLIQSVVQLDALQLVGPNTSLFQELITLAHTANASLEIMEFLFPYLLIPIICAFALIPCVHQFLQFFLLVNEFFLQQFMVLHLTFQLLIPDPAQLLIVYFILLHASNDVFENLGLHRRLLELLPHGYHFVFLANHQLVGLLPLFLHGLVSALQKVDVFPFQLQSAQPPSGLLGSLVIILPDGAKVLSHNCSLIQFASRSHLHQMCLIQQIFLGVIESGMCGCVGRLMEGDGAALSFGSSYLRETFESRLRGVCGASER